MTRCFHISFITTLSALKLLGISDTNAARIEAQLLEKVELLRPGFTRISLSYVTSLQDVDYIVDAVRMIATHGWRLLPLYQFNHKSGECKHRSRLRSFPERVWLSR